MQTNHYCPRIDTNHTVNNVGSLLAGDISSAIASKLASYNCIIPSQAFVVQDQPMISDGRHCPKLMPTESPFLNQPHWRHEP
jgi:hypothetical protein